jgi:NADH dehydrogenase/NADH:ubiquinone oxidoreductase subunit G
MNEVVEVTLNGLGVKAKPGTTILEIARANGVEIPTLCHHEELSPIAACRLCVVEIEGSRTLVASCHTPIVSGMVIYTHSPKVLEARRIIIELLLARHPNACIFCNKANMCELRAIAADLDVGALRFRLASRYYPIEDDNPYIIRDLTKCVLCRRCVRACREVKRGDIYAVSYRGSDSKVTVGFDEFLNNEICRDCDVCISVCPTGALDRRDQKPVSNKEPQVFTINKE